MPSTFAGGQCVEPDLAGLLALLALFTGVGTGSSRSSNMEPSPSSCLRQCPHRCPHGMGMFAPSGMLSGDVSGHLP